MEKKTYWLHFYTKICILSVVISTQRGQKD